MRKGLFSLAAVGLLATGSMAACGDDSGTPSGGSSGGASVGKVGVILPDTKISARWATADAKYLKEAFDAAGVQADIQNAQGDKAAFQTIADGMISTNWIMGLLLDAFGRAVLRKGRLRTKYIAPIYENEAVTAVARVGSLTDGPDGETVMQLEVWCETGSGRKVTVGDALVHAGGG